MWTSLVTLALSVGLLTLLVSDRPHLTVNLFSPIVSLCNLSLWTSQRGFMHSLLIHLSLTLFLKKIYVYLVVHVGLC